MRTKDRVKMCLSRDSDTRDSDRRLILDVWRDEGLVLTPTQEEMFLYKVSSPETIRRLRQKFQEQGLYLASKEVDDKRYEMFKETRQNIKFTDNISLFN